MKLAEVVERILLQGLDIMERMDTECNLNTVPSSIIYVHCGKGILSKSFGWICYLSNESGRRKFDIPSKRTYRVDHIHRLLSVCVGSH